MTLHPYVRSKAGRIAALGLLAFALLAARFSPDWFAFIEVAREAKEGAANPGEQRAIEQRLLSRYAERGYYVARQAEDLRTEIDEPRHKIVRWRLLVPGIGRLLGLPGWAVLALAHLGCVALVLYLAHLGARAGAEGGAFCFALIAGASAPFFTSMGWLGYYDSWLAIALLAVGYGRSRAALLAACVLAPWIDERFVLGLPLALGVRRLREPDASALATRQWVMREALPALALAGAYAAVRLALGGSGGSQSVGEYLQGFVFGQETSALDRLRGAWEGLRFAWVVIAAALAEALWSAPRERRRGLLGLLGLGGATALAGLYTAQDTSRSMVLLIVAAPLAWSALAAREWWGRFRAGPALALLAVLVPAHHAVSGHTIAVEAFWQPPAQVVAAANNLGVAYANGAGVAADIHRAIKWYRVAAEAGDATAATNLGKLHATDARIATDYAEALAWFRRAAAGGDASGMACLGIMYAEGLGVPADRAEAVRWHRRGAEAGDPAAQNNLASAYQHGDSVPKDAQAARDWYRKAAEQGFAPAQLHLGRLLAGDDGRVRDLAESWLWLTVAAETGSTEAAQLRPLVEQHLSPAQRVEAKRRLDAWLKARR